MKVIQDYLNRVLEQIRVKKIRPILGRELEDHLLLQTQEYQRQGMDQEKAQQQAVVDMGDPVALGKQLDGIHRPMWDIPMLVYALLVVALGLVIQFLLPVWQSTQVPPNLNLPIALVGIGGGLVGFWLASRFSLWGIVCSAKKAVFSVFFDCFGNGGCAVSYRGTALCRLVLLALYSLFRGSHPAVSPLRTHLDLFPPMPFPERTAAASALSAAYFDLLHVLLQFRGISVLCGGGLGAVSPGRHQILYRFLPRVTLVYWHLGALFGGSCHLLELFAPAIL